MNEWLLLNLATPVNGTLHCKINKWQNPEEREGKVKGNRGEKQMQWDNQYSPLLLLQYT